ncbi:hypothetical protein GOBAR_AA23889 [Gossypium barbadense]|uniref:Uncharacterized protein n=1 Tax=Gossypium barbadense TaxID=3634 RepID=A0A2P5X0B3_GOSBA|nr:hypothetical protein GOBAR_AA23889 [Gossypium barbadense]
MTDGTSLKLLDESMKSVQQSQTSLRKDLDSLSTSFASHQQMLQEILNRLCPPTSTPPFQIEFYYFISSRLKPSGRLQTSTYPVCSLLWI